MITGIEHVAICAKDTKALKDWYTRMFAFRTVYDNGKGTYFLMAPNGAMIEIIQAAEPGGILGEKVAGLRHLALSVDDFDEMVARLKGENVEVVAAPVVSPTGIKTFFFRDPEGNILHLIYRPEPLG
jgi:glyoxylase I family protein